MQVENKTVQERAKTEFVDTSLGALPMPDTGLFYILALDYGADDARIGHVNSITIRCNRCHHVTRLNKRIERIEGGTVLTCGKCGARQAVSNARLAECDHSLGHARS